MFSTVSPDTCHIEIVEEVHPQEGTIPAVEAQDSSGVPTEDGKAPLLPT